MVLLSNVISYTQFNKLNAHMQFCMARMHCMTIAHVQHVLRMPVTRPNWAEIAKCLQVHFRYLLLKFHATYSTGANKAKYLWVS